MRQLENILQKEERWVIGLMSGTSADGVDAALVKLRGSGLNTRLKLIAFETLPYPQGLKELILEVSSLEKGTVNRICRLNFLLGEVFAQAAINIVKKARMEPCQIDLIGSHGQTICHLPQEEEIFGYPIRSTLQLAEPSIIAKRTGILTVADFRPADMALGGQGAPLVPYFDYLMFRSQEKNRGILNIGGIANLTVLKKGCDADDVVAFDTGPGNMIVDGLMRRLYHRSFDEDGEVAQSGEVSEELLQTLMGHPYFQQPPPKSTGWEVFGDGFITEVLDQANRLGLKKENLIATLTELTAQSIDYSYKKYIQPQSGLDELIVSGGGVRNQALMNSLRKYFHNISLKTSDDFGIPSEAKEAICFAVLANETVSGNPANLPAATGAKKRVILGKLCYA